MNILFCGTPEPAAIVLEELIQKIDQDMDQHQLVGVLTRPDAKQGRGKKIKESEVALLAQSNGLPVYKFSSLKDKAIEEELLALEADVAVVVAYGMLIPVNLLNIFQHGWLNLHYSLLPQWRGAAPVQAALLSGNPHTGSSIFQIEKGMDTGPVLLTQDYEFLDTDTTGSVLEKLSHSGAELILDGLDSLENGTGIFTPQDENQATLAPKITSADAEIDWNQPVDLVSRTIRAYTPAPGPWTTLGDQRFKIGQVCYPDSEIASVHSSEFDLRSGEIATVDKKMYVGTANTPLEVVTIQPAGKKMMSAPDWFRGYQGQETVFSVGSEQ